MRPIFCGNFEYDARQSDLERLFRRYGRVERVDMKSGKFSCHEYQVLFANGGSFYPVRYSEVVNLKPKSSVYWWGYDICYSI
ncbi:hypothetical protein SLEP1_g17081 [Rubroshorea leprosula]|uniref:RRM domain-containing protein n=1 Tax=Rubroshorea leprosula TaxID=152421 RepID=A0AAV5J275_9ROSI|nr:hypothetical protein SLEP1_g17081 [Rubroshorea leprosula]